MYKLTIIEEVEKVEQRLFFLTLKDGVSGYVNASASSSNYWKCCLKGDSVFYKRDENDDEQIIIMSKNDMVRQIRGSKMFYTISNEDKETIMDLCSLRGVQYSAFIELLIHEEAQKINDNEKK